MLDVLIAFAIFLAASSLGKLGSRLINVKPRGYLEMVVVEVALGCALLSMAIAALGFLGLLRTWAVWALVLPLAAAGVYLQIARLRSGAWRRLSLKGLDWLDWVVLGAAGALLGILLGLGLVPATGQNMSHDGLAYQLTLPKLFIDYGRISHIPSMDYSTYPLGMNMLFVPGLMLGRTPPAHLLHLGMALTTAVAMGLMAARRANRMTGILAPAAFLAIPLVQDEATWAMVDLALTLYTWLALYAIVRWRETSHRSWLVLAGGLAGFACSIKLTAVFGVAALGVILLGFVLGGSRPVGNRVSALAGFVVPLLLLGVPWYIRNTIVAGNPFHPYFHTLFGGTSWSWQASERYMSYVRSCGLDLPLWIGVAASAGWMLAAGVIAFKTKLSLFTKILSVYVLLWLALWIISGSPQKRFLLPILPAVVLLGVWFVSMLARRGVFLRYALYGVVVLGLLLGSARLVQQRGDMLAVVVGLEDRESFLSHQVYMYPAYQFANTQLPDSAQLFVFPEDRTFYLDLAYIWGDPIFSDAIDYGQYGSSSALLDELEALEISHVVVLRPAYAFWRQLVAHDPQATAYVEHALELVDGLEDVGAQVVFRENGVAIYELTGTGES